jgi:hypothetical protein
MHFSADCEDTVQDRGELYRVDFNSDEMKGRASRTNPRIALLLTPTIKAVTPMFRLSCSCMMPLKRWMLSRVEVDCRVDNGPTPMDRRLMGVITQFLRIFRNFAYHAKPNKLPPRCRILANSIPKESPARDEQVLRIYIYVAVDPV